ncbi:MAG: hypothetical protein A2Y56_09075 [Candidatus Aminicenantes bacterium RBG_13_63_10]|nr:MAG: hypothetical protein A2Y56_09075 [Candidatus Aminicenantes bacterium RBG_13_63_10]
MKPKVLLSASLFHALNDAASVVVPMTLPLLYSQKYLITRYAQIGLLSNLGLMTTLVFQTLVAHYADRFEYRRILVWSCLGLTASLALITTARSFLLLLAFHLLMRVFNSFYHPLGIALVSRAYPCGDIDRAMGVQSGSGNLGVFLAFLTSGFLTQALGWRAPLLAWAGLGVLLGALSYLAVRRLPRGEVSLKQPRASTWLETAALIKDFIPGFVYGGAGWGVTIYFAPSLFHHKFGLTLGQTGIILALWIGLGTVVTYGFGRLSRSLGRRNLSLLSMFGSALCLAILGTASSSGPALAALLLFGGFLFLIYPAMQSYVGNRVPESRQALAFSLVSNIQVLAGAIVALVSGFLSDRFGIHTPFLMMAAVGVLLAIYYWRQAPRA